MHDAVKPASQVLLLGKRALLAVRLASAPAAMYLLGSVLPSSITSGARPPARAASSFVRCSPQVWISTLTFTSGCELSKERFAALTTAAQSGPCASVISQTVSVDAL